MRHTVLAVLIETIQPKDIKNTQTIDSVRPTANLILFAHELNKWKFILAKAEHKTQRKPHQKNTSTTCVFMRNSLTNELSTKHTLGKSIGVVLFFPFPTAY